MDMNRRCEMRIVWGNMFTPDPVIRNFCRSCGFVWFSYSRGAKCPKCGMGGWTGRRSGTS